MLNHEQNELVQAAVLETLRALGITAVPCAQPPALPTRPQGADASHAALLAFLATREAVTIREALASVGLSATPRTVQKAGALLRSAGWTRDGKRTGGGGRGGVPRDRTYRRRELIAG